MYYLIGIPLLNGGITWQTPNTTVPSHPSDNGFSLSIRFSSQLTPRSALYRAWSLIEKESYDWVRRRNEKWFFDFDKLKIWRSSRFQNKNDSEAFLEELDWLTGELEIKPDVRDVQDLPFTIRPRTNTFVTFSVYKEVYLMTQYRRVFLSHKGADKPMVRQFNEVLKDLGFDTWLDENAMPAGTELHRGIQQGFADSCAAVFFITPNFRDETHLRNEINYAIAQKTEKQERFAIITLAFKNESGERGIVPPALHAYVWKTPDTELEGLREILKALPLSLDQPQWR